MCTDAKALAAVHEVLRVHMQAEGRLKTDPTLALALTLTLTQPQPQPQPNPNPNPNPDPSPNPNQGAKPRMGRPVPCAREHEAPRIAGPAATGRLVSDDPFRTAIVTDLAARLTSAR